MCGLAGGTLYDELSIAPALRQIQHRGYDAVGMERYDRGMWLGHRRLSIQDTSTGADQPYETRNASLVFNGELWRSTLGEYGHLRQETTSDTEVLARMYEEHGGDLVDFARRLDGMFAFAILDFKRDRLVLARDWLGRIPLYCRVVGEDIAFASEAKAMTGPLGLKFAGSYKSGGDVHLFPPGVIMSFPMGGGNPVAHRFASFDAYREPGQEFEFDLAYYADGLKRRLVAAVDNEAVSDVPVCTILSGGVDSTIITAILSLIVPNVVAYTVSVGDSDGKDDLHWARRAAEAIGIELREVIVDPDDAVRGLEEAVWAVEDDRWVQVAPAVPQIALARRIGEDGFKVVFGGEGSDELFGSYGDVRRWAWQPHQYHRRRVELCERLHNNNLIRGNKSMMWGGTVELRTPFLDREVVDFCLRIPPRFRSNDDGRGSVLKPVLREAFRGWIPDDLLMRKKVTFQEGAHSDFLKGYGEVIRGMMRELFG